jgi:hypothetical protein
LNVATNLSTLEICFDFDDFTSQQRDWMEAGFREYWGDEMDAVGVPIEFEFTSASSCDENLAEVIRSDAPDVPNNCAIATISQNGHGDAKIRVDSDASFSEDQWKALADREERLARRFGRPAADRQAGPPGARMRDALDATTLGTHVTDQLDIWHLLEKLAPAARVAFGEPRAATC